MKSKRIGHWTFILFKDFEIRFIPKIDFKLKKKYKHFHVSFYFFKYVFRIDYLNNKRIFH